MRASAATELAASSSGLMQADDGVLSHASWRLSRFTRRHSVLYLGEPDIGLAPKGGRLIEVGALGVSSH
jgi:hypothetical protein